MNELIFNKGTIRLQPKFETKGFDKINGISISTLAEEMLWEFSGYAFNKKYADDSLFVNNAWKDIKVQLPKELQNLNFPKDFMKTFCMIETVKANEKAKKSEYNKIHKKEIAEEKERNKELFGYCIKDGVKTPIGNSVVEKSRFFISRGELRGRWVRRVEYEDISLNTSDKNYPCVENHNWKSVEFKDVDYIATYKIDIGFETAFVDKFVWLSADSEDKQEDTEHKYEKARLLSVKMDSLEKRIAKDCLSENKSIMENALICWLLSTFVIRVGNDKGDGNIRDKNVRGASTLCVENIKLDFDKKTISLDFIGKDSVRYQNTKKANEKIISQFEKCIKNKKPTDMIFDKATSTSANEYLKSIYKGEISPKLWRTAKGSLTLAEQFQKRDWENLTDKEFKNQVKECCFETTKLLNHKKTLSDEQIEKFEKSSKEKLDSAKINLKKAKKTMNESIDKIESDRKKAYIKFAKDILEKKLKEFDEKEKSVKEKYELAERKFDSIKSEIEFKKESLDSNISTAINSYSSPKLSFSLCKKADKDPSLLYTKAQLSKFDYAKDVDEDYFMKYPNVD